MSRINFFTKEFLLLIPNSLANFTFVRVEIINKAIRNKTINFIKNELIN